VAEGGGGKTAEDGEESGMIILAICVWVACGVIACGLTIGYSIHRWPEFRVGPFPIGISLLGPVALLAALLLCYPYHFSFRPLTKEERWEAHQREYPDSTREDFEKTDLWL